jgi:hypothetical protein
MDDIRKVQFYVTDERDEYGKFAQIVAVDKDKHEIIFDIGSTDSEYYQIIFYNPNSSYALLEQVNFAIQSINIQQPKTSDNEPIIYLTGYFTDKKLNSFGFSKKMKEETIQLNNPYDKKWKYILFSNKKIPNKISLRIDRDIVTITKNTCIKIKINRMLGSKTYEFKCLYVNDVGTAYKLGGLIYDSEKGQTVDTSRGKKVAIDINKKNSNITLVANKKEYGISLVSIQPCLNEPTRDEDGRYSDRDSRGSVDRYSDRDSIGSKYRYSEDGRQSISESSDESKLIDYQNEEQQLNDEIAIFREKKPGDCVKLIIRKEKELFPRFFKIKEIVESSNEIVIVGELFSLSLNSWAPYLIYTSEDTIWRLVPIIDGQTYNTHVLELVSIDFECQPSEVPGPNVGVNPSSVAPAQLVNPASVAPAQLVNPASVAPAQLVNPANVVPAQLVNPANVVPDTTSKLLQKNENENVNDDLDNFINTINVNNCITLITSKGKLFLLKITNKKTNLVNREYIINGFIENDDGWDTNQSTLIVSYEDKNIKLKIGDVTHEIFNINTNRNKIKCSDTPTQSVETIRHLTPSIQEQQKLQRLQEQQEQQERQLQQQLREHMLEQEQQSKLQKQYYQQPYGRQEQQQPFSQPQQPYSHQQQPYSQYQQPYSQYQQPYSQYQQPYGQPHQSYGQQQPFGQPQQSYWQQQQQQQQPFGQPQQSYWQQQQPFGQYQQQQSFGQPQQSYGQQQQPFGQQQQSFGQPQQPIEQQKQLSKQKSSTQKQQNTPLFQEKFNDRNHLRSYAQLALLKLRGAKLLNAIISENAKITGGFTGGVVNDDTSIINDGCNKLIFQYVLEQPPGNYTYPTAFFQIDRIETTGEGTIIHGKEFTFNKETKKYVVVKYSSIDFNNNNATYVLSPAIKCIINMDTLRLADCYTDPRKTKKNSKKDANIVIDSKIKEATIDTQQALEDAKVAKEKVEDAKAHEAAVVEEARQSQGNPDVLNELQTIREQVKQLEARNIEFERIARDAQYNLSDLKSKVDQASKYFGDTVASVQGNFPQLFRQNSANQVGRFVEDTQLKSFPLLSTDPFIDEGKEEKSSEIDEGNVARLLSAQRNVEDRPVDRTRALREGELLSLLEEEKAQEFIGEKNGVLQGYDASIPYEEITLPPRRSDRTFRIKYEGDKVNRSITITDTTTNQTRKYKLNECITFNTGENGQRKVYFKIALILSEQNQITGNIYLPISDVQWRIVTDPGGNDIYSFSFGDKTNKFDESDESFEVSNPLSSNRMLYWNSIDLSAEGCAPRTPPPPRSQDNTQGGSRIKTLRRNKNRYSRCK